MGKISKIANVDHVKEVLESSKSYREAILKLGLSYGGRNLRRLYKLVDTQGWEINFLNQYSNNRRIPDENIFVENSEYIHNSIQLKLRYLNFFNIAYKCVECGLRDQWQGKIITLQLDHINGINNDNRFEKLPIHLADQTPPIAAEGSAAAGFWRRAARGSHDP